MKALLTNFATSEDGAVTVDWVVLTASLLIIGVVVVGSIANGATNMSGSAGGRLSAATVPQVVF